MRALRRRDQVRAPGACRSGGPQWLRNAAFRTGFVGAVGATALILPLFLAPPLTHLGRIVNQPLGWIMILAPVLIHSTSSALGRISPYLFFMTACLITMTGFVQTVPAVSRRRVSVRFSHDTWCFGLSASPINFLGSKS